MSHIHFSCVLLLLAVKRIVNLTHLVLRKSYPLSIHDSLEHCELNKSRYVFVRFTLESLERVIYGLVLFIKTNLSSLGEHLTFNVATQAECLHTCNSTIRIGVG